MKKKILPICVILLVTYLFVWPVSLRPVAWQPSKPVESVQVRPLNPVQRLGDGVLKGPEALTFTSTGEMITGLADGRVVSVSSDFRSCKVLGQVDGRPLGVALDGEGRALVADAQNGVVQLQGGTELRTLVHDADGIPVKFADDLTIDGQGRVYLTDVSWKYGFDEQMLDVLEHGAHGRLIRYQPEDDLSVTMLAELNFANGVTLGPDETYILINETTAYRVTRFWLKGDKAGQREIFSDNLPGFPDNISFNGQDRFWVALFAPRSAILDAIAPYPLLRRMIVRLPSVLHPKASDVAQIVALDMNGAVVEHYRDLDGNGFGPITSVVERGGYLYFGSLAEDAVGRVSLSALRGGSQVSPTSISMQDCQH